MSISFEYFIHWQMETAYNYWADEKKKKIVPIRVIPTHLFTQKMWNMDFGFEILSKSM